MTSSSGRTVELGPFKVRFVALSHSIPEGNGVLIETPFGRVFHTGDWKIDETPVLGEASSPDVLTKIGDEGVLALVCDSTNVFQDAASGSEEGVHKGMAEQVAKAKGRVLVTTFASNAARLQTRRVATENAAGCASPAVARPHPAAPGDRRFARFPYPVRCGSDAPPRDTAGRPTAARRPRGSSGDRVGQTRAQVSRRDTVIV